MQTSERNVDQKLPRKNTFDTSIVTFAQSGISNVSQNNSVTPSATKTFGDENFALQDASNVTEAVPN